MNEKLPFKPHFFDATATSDPYGKQATSFIKTRAKVNLQNWSSFPHRTGYQRSLLELSSDIPASAGKCFRRRTR